MFDKLILTLSLVNLLTNSAYSSIAPFYPLEAAKKGVNPLLIGKLAIWHRIAYEGLQVSYFL